MPLPNYDLIVFDLDGTLAPSKSPLEPDMADLLFKLFKQKKVAVISGGAYPQFQKQFLKELPQATEGLNNLVLLPTSGTRMYIWRRDWHEQYAEDFSPAEREKILTTLNAAIKMSGVKTPDKLYGPQIEDRGSQITYSALGQSAPLSEKSNWDPDRKKREKIVSFAEPKLKQFDVRIGGTTSVDITRRGVNKGYGIRKLEEHLKIPTEKILFIGDALFPGGNDYPARAAGVDCVPVKGPEEVKIMIKDWLS